MKTCRVCSSPHRDEYEEMRFKQNRQIKDIWIYAKNKYNEDLGYYCFVRHFKHVENEMNALKKTSRLRQQIVEEEIKKDIEIAQRLRRNLEICAQNIEKYARREDLTPEEEKSLLEFISKSTLIIEELLKWSKQLDVTPRTEDVFKRILYCMADFPVELVKKFEERWRNYGLS